MKKLILSLALICFVGASKMYAQTSDTKVTPPTPAATTLSPVSTDAAHDASVQSDVPAKETSAKPEVKKSGCKSSSKSCCMSKEKASAKKDCNHKHAEKAEVKTEKSEIIQTTN